MLWIFCRSVLFLLAHWCWVTFSPGLSVLLFFVNQIDSTASSVQMPLFLITLRNGKHTTGSCLILDVYSLVNYYSYYLSHFLSLTCVQICWSFYRQRKVDVAALSQQSRRKLLSRQLLIKQKILDMGFWSIFDKLRWDCCPLCWPWHCHQPSRVQTFLMQLPGYFIVMSPRSKSCIEFDKTLVAMGSTGEHCSVSRMFFLSHYIKVMKQGFDSPLNHFNVIYLVAWHYLIFQINLFTERFLITINYWYTLHRDHLKEETTEKCFSDSS